MKGETYLMARIKRRSKPIIAIVLTVLMLATMVPFITLATDELTLTIDPVKRTATIGEIEDAVSYTLYVFETLEDAEADDPSRAIAFYVEDAATPSSLRAATPSSLVISVRETEFDGDAIRDPSGFIPGGKGIPGQDQDKVEAGFSTNLVPGVYFFGVKAKLADDSETPIVAQEGDTPMSINMGPDEAAKLIGDRFGDLGESLRIVDVRGASEIGEEGHIRYTTDVFAADAASGIVYDALLSHVTTRGVDEVDAAGVTVMVYDRGGANSVVAAANLKALGFNVIDISGVNQWELGLVYSAPEYPIDDPVDAPFKIRDLEFISTAKSLVGVPPYGNVNAPANSIAFRNIPYAGFEILVYEQKLDPATPTSLYAKGTIAKPLANDFETGENNTYKAWVVFELKNLDKALVVGTKYFVYIKAIDGVGIVGPETGVNWGGESPISEQFVEVTIPTPPPPTTPDPPPPVAPPPETTEPPPKDPELPKADIVPTEPTEEEVAEVEEAVADLIEDAADRWGGVIEQVGPPIVVTLPKAEPTIVTLKDIPEEIKVSDVTVMCKLNPDGTLTPVPTRIDKNGNIVVLLTDDAILVPLSVHATFSDLGRVVSHVKDEIERAASLMVVEGFPNGTFHPGEAVTTQQAVTMFLRATGIPVDWATAMATGVDSGYIGAGLTANAPMTRTQAAALIVNALKHFGLDYKLDKDEVDEYLKPFTDMVGQSEADRLTMAICVKLKIFRGSSANHMKPTGILNRSQMASLAVRLQDELLDFN